MEHPYMIFQYIPLLAETKKLTAKRFLMTYPYILKTSSF